MSAGQTIIQRARLAAQSDRQGLAVMLLRNLIQAAPELGESWRQVANQASNLKDFGAAAKAMRLLVESGSDDFRSLLGLGQNLLRAGATEELETVVDRLLEMRPDSADAVYSSAVLYNITARSDLAIERFRRSVELDPSRTTAWGAISRLKALEPDDPDWKEILKQETALQNGSIEQRMPVTYALATGYEKQGDYERAFHYYKKGAEENLKLNEGVQIFRNDFFQKMQDIFDADLLAKATGSEEDRPIFVVGPPRSGTTLTESILVAHSHVSNGAEMTSLHVATYPFQAALRQGRTDLDQAVRERIGDNPWRKMANLYMLLSNERMGDKMHFVDSSAALYQQAGYILAAFPKAKIIWVSRDIRDSLWSIYKMRFETGQIYTYDFKAIHEHLKWSRAFRDHFHKLAPDQVLLLQYEDLAREPDVWIPRMLAHCGLPYEDGVLRFHENKRQVATASSQQIRQPISTKSIGAWRKYFDHLDPIYKKLLGPDYDKAAPSSALS